MKSLNSFYVLACCSFAMSACVPSEKDFVFSPYTVISVQDELQKEEAEWFAWLFARPAGFVLQVKLQAAEPDVILCRDESLMGDAYSLEVTTRKILIRASSPNGFFYAFQTLRQALPQEIRATRHVGNVRWAVPTMKVYESPKPDFWLVSNFRSIANIRK